MSESNAVEPIDDVDKSKVDCSNVDFSDDPNQLDLALNIQRGNPYGIIGDVWVFILIIFMEVFTNYDVGAVAVMITEVKGPYKFTETDLGILGALPFLGLIIVSTFAGRLLSKVKSQYLCSISIGTNAIAVGLFACSFHKYMFYGGRFLIGVSQGIFSIYAPVWVDTFSPLKYRTLWMGLLQGSIVLGNVLGYLVTAILKFTGSWGWRYSLAFQTACLFVQFVIYSSLKPNKVNLPMHIHLESDPTNTKTYSEYIQEDNISRISLPNLDMDINENIQNRRYTDDFAIYGGYKYSSMLNMSKYKLSFDVNKFSHSRHESSTHFDQLGVISSDNIVQDFFALFKNGLYLPVVSSLCALYFELTGIQYWVTTYLIRKSQTTEALIYTVYSATAITSPATGVLFGSFVVDRYSGYDDKSILTLFCILLFWSLICVGCGIIAVIFNRNFIAIVIQTWFVLFFGGCIVPSALVLSINTVEPRLRPLASSVSFAMYNFFGYIAGSVVPGYVADLVNDITAIIYVIFLWAIVGSFSMVVCIIVKLYQNYKHKVSASLNTMKA